MKFVNKADIPDMQLVEIYNPYLIEQYVQQLVQEDGTASDHRPFAGTVNQQHFWVVQKGINKAFISTSQTQDTVHLVRLLVFSEWRRQGIAGKIFKYLLQQEGKLKSQVIADNQPAINCYSKYQWQFTSLVMLKNDQQLVIELDGKENSRVKTLADNGWSPYYYNISFSSRI